MGNKAFQAAIPTLVPVFRGGPPFAIITDADNGSTHLQTTSCRPNMAIVDADNMMSQPKRV